MDPKDPLLRTPWPRQHPKQCGPRARVLPLLQPTGSLGRGCPCVSSPLILADTLPFAYWKLRHRRCTCGRSWVSTVEQEPSRKCGRGWVAPVHCRGTPHRCPWQREPGLPALRGGDSAGRSLRPPQLHTGQGRAASASPEGQHHCQHGLWLSWDVLPEDHTPWPLLPLMHVAALGTGVGWSPGRPPQLGLGCGQRGKGRDEAEKQEPHFTAGVRSGMFQS